MLKKSWLLWVVVVLAVLLSGASTWSANDFYVIPTSQWKRNGPSIYYTAGNVGIGTDNPTALLTIGGDNGIPVVASSGAIHATVIEGSSTASIGTGCGVKGSTSSTDLNSYGVYGYAPNGYAKGVFGYGLAGVVGQSNGNGPGVIGYNSVSPTGFGVYGENNQAGGVGIQGVNTATTGNGAGVKGVSDSNDASATGVYGFGYTGVYGTGPYGVYGQASSPSAFGVYCNGNFGCTGNAEITGDLIVHGSTKSAVVPTSRGDRKLYCQESPEVWFEDFGEGQLVGGTARIDLDHLFLETVTIDEKNPLKVFIQLKDDCNGVYVRPQSTGFEVKELRNGNSNASFTYRVVAKRKGFETARLESAGDTTKVAAFHDTKK